MTPLERFLATAGAAVMSVGAAQMPAARTPPPAVSIMAEVIAPTPRPNPLRTPPALAAARATAPEQPTAMAAAIPSAPATGAGRLGPPRDIADLILRADDASGALAFRFADAIPAPVSPAFAPGGPLDPDAVGETGRTVAGDDAMRAAPGAVAAAAGREEGTPETTLPSGLSAAIPLPRRRPAVPLARRDRPETAEVQVARLTPGDGLPPPDRRSPAGDLACMTALASLGIAAERLPTIKEGSCGVEAPLELTEIGRGAEAVEFAPKTTINCGVAGALAEWLRDDVQPAARSAFGQRVTGIRVAASYACRGRNNNPRARLSEHAYGNAIDISGFRLADGAWVEVRPRPSPREARFLAAVRQEACGPFTTVLGPGVAQHDTHFHLDLARRGRSGRSLYCR